MIFSKEHNTNLPLLALSESSTWLKPRRSESNGFLALVAEKIYVINFGDSQSLLHIFEGCI